MLPSPRLCSELMEKDWLARPSGVTCLGTFLHLSYEWSIHNTNYQILNYITWAPNIQHLPPRLGTHLSLWTKIDFTVAARRRMTKDQEWKSKIEMFKATFNCCDDEEKQLMVQMSITWTGTPLPQEMRLTQTPTLSHLPPQGFDPTWLFKVLFLILLLLVKLLGSAVRSRISIILWEKWVMEALQLATPQEEHCLHAFAIGLPTSKLQGPTCYSEVA